jgi:hypothetical protein
LADRVVIHCRWCGYLTVGRDVVCARCGESLTDAIVVSGTTTGRGSSPPTPTSEVASDPVPVDLPPYDELAPPPAPHRSLGLAAVATLLGLFLVAASFVGFVVFDTVRKQQMRSSAKAELRRLLAAQPDFRAIGEGSAGPAFVGGPMLQKADRLYITLRLPRNQVLRDRSLVGLANVGLIVADHRSPTIVIPEVRGFGPFPQKPGGKPFLTLKQEFAAILDIEDVEVDVIGNETVNGYLARTYKVVDTKNRANYMYVSLAPSLRNLVVKCAIRWRDGRLEEDLSFTLRDVAFDVDAAALEVPVDYTRIPGG